MKLLIVVDYQNDFVVGTLGFEKAKSLEKKIYNKIIDYQRQEHDVVFTYDTHEKNYLDTQEGKKLPIPHCIKGTEGWELYGKIKHLTGYRIEKNTFGSLSLISFLKNSRYEEIELIGVVTNVCVLSNAIIAKTVLPEARIIVDATCAASYDDDLHEKTLDIMNRLQIDVINRGTENE